MKLEPFTSAYNRSEMGAEEEIRAAEHGRRQSDLRDRLSNWAKERPLRYHSQRSVRVNIANAITTDILHPVGSEGNPEKVNQYRHWVDGASAYAIERLIAAGLQDPFLRIEIPDQDDSVAGETFTTTILREGKEWVSRESTPERVISEARLSDNGETRITLSYSGDRYAARYADPGINQQEIYPTGAKVLFVNHVASVGVIDWGRRTRSEIKKRLQKH